MKKIILSGALILIASAGFGQIDRSVRPKAGAAPTINIKDPEVFTTPNGITVILSENHKLPEVSIRLVTGSDPRLEGSKAGLSEVAGQLIMSGTTNRTKDKLDKEIDYVGATLVADGTSMYLSCLTKHLDKGLDLMTDVLFNANFPESEFQRVKRQNESELLSAKSSLNKMASHAVKRANFPAGHPYAEIMTDNTLASITRADVESYFKQVFTPSESYLVIVGDVTKDQAISLANKYFAAWKGGPAYKADLGQGQFNKGNRVIFVKKPGSVQSVVMVTFPVKMKSGDKNVLALDVTNEILGGGAFGSRLTQNLREDKGFTYGCNSILNISNHGSLFYTLGSFRNEVTDSAIVQILKEIDGISDSYVKDSELGLTKSVMAGDFARSLESPQTIASFALDIIQNKLPKDYYQTYLKRLDAVNKEAVLGTAQTYLTAKNCNIIVVGSEDVLEKLKVFDTDGKIEMFDAFGDVVKEMKPATISKDQLIEKYVLANTQTTSMKGAAKKIKKIKSVKQVIEMSSEAIPAPLTMTTYFVAPNKESMKLEMQGNVIQKAYFDGKTGASTDMQTGKKELTAEEIASKQKSAGLFPELTYATSGVKYDLLGIESLNGVEVYVLKIEDGEKQTFDYFDTKTFLKMKSVSIEKKGEEMAETSKTFSDYKAVEGILFPYQSIWMMGEMGFNGKVIAIEVNGTVDATAFK